MAITKASLTQALNDEIGLNQREAKGLVDQFFAEIKTTLTQAEAVKLSGFGNFILRDKASRPGRNPKTGEAAVISARRSVAFKPEPKFKNQINHPLTPPGPTTQTKPFSFFPSASLAKLFLL